MSPYSYAANNPLKYTDSDGRKLINNTTKFYAFYIGWHGTRENPGFQTVGLVDPGHTLAIAGEDHDFVIVYQVDEGGNLVRAQNAVWTKTKVKGDIAGVPVPGDLDITYEINENPDGKTANIALDKGLIDQKFGLTHPAELQELQTTQAALRDALLSVQGKITNLEKQFEKKPDGRSPPALRKALQRMLDRQKQLYRVIEAEIQSTEEDIRKLTGQE